MKRIQTVLFLLIAFLSLPSLLQASPLESMNSWIESQLSSGSSSLSSFFFLFLGGVLASLLPCTYPLYPITINILKNRSTGSNKIIHPVVYYIGIAGIYFLFGIIASVTGGAFNTVLQYPLTNLIIAIIIFLMGLSSMDLLLLPLFSGSTINQNKKNLTATFVMGMTAGLLSSACVGPVVVSILIGIASNSVAFSWVAAFTAASKMLLFGIGVGLPFLLIGVFGVSLPKSGKWMKYVQLALGIIILYFSYTYLEKALLGFGWNQTAIATTGAGILAILLSAFYFQSEQLPIFTRTKNALLLLSGITGAALLFKSVNTSAGTNLETATVNAAIASNTSTQMEKKGELTWYLDKETAYAVAKEKNKPVFVDFHADWCTNCKEFQKLTQSNTELNEVLKNSVLLKVYEGTNIFKTYAADKRFPELKVGLPFFLVTDKDENLLYKTNDYLKTDEMILFLTN